MTFETVSAWFSALSFSDWLAFASAVLAIVSFAISQAAVRRQERMQYEALRAARDSDLIAWADGAIDAIADAQRFCRDVKNALIDGPAAAESQSELRTRLSAYLDKGRLFFPNQPSDDDDDGDPLAPAKPSEAAYEGKPHPAIDALFRVYRLMSDFGRNDMSAASAVKTIVAQRRRFVSEVFVSIDPRRREMALRQIAR